MFTECDVFHLPNCILSHLARLPLKTTGEKTKLEHQKLSGKDKITQLPYTQDKLPQLTAWYPSFYNTLLPDLTSVLTSLLLFMRKLLKIIMPHDQWDSRKPSNPCHCLSARFILKHPKRIGYIFLILRDGNSTIFLNSLLQFYFLVDTSLCPLHTAV